MKKSIIYLQFLVKIWWFCFVKTRLYVHTAIFFTEQSLKVIVDHYFLLNYYVKKQVDILIFTFVLAWVRNFFILFVLGYKSINHATLHSQIAPFDVICNMSSLWSGVSVASSWCKDVAVIKKLRTIYGWYLKWKWCKTKHHQRLEIVIQSI